MCDDVRAAEEANTSDALPEEYAENYVIASEMVSPNGNLAVTVAKGVQRRCRRTGGIT